MSGVRGVLLGVAIWLAFAPLGTAAEQTPRGRLFFLGVAVDEHPPTGKSIDHYNYAPDNFLRLFHAHSKSLFTEIHASKLLGHEATHGKVLAVLKKLHGQVRADDLLFLYWGTHGSTDRSGWSASIAGGEFAGEELKRELKQFPCPVVIAVSTCGSGGFAESIAAAQPPPGYVPDNVTALCACHTYQSTNNELDVSLLEALTGFGDLDGDGEVTLGEALEYVPHRYRDWSRPAGRSDPRLLPVLGQSSHSPLDRPLAKVTAERCLVAHNGRWYGADILARLPDGRLEVRYLGFDTTCTDGSFSMPNQVVPAEQVLLPGKGTPLEVEWHGSWYPARLLEKTEHGARIHYVGYPATDDETVTRDRIRVVYAGVAGKVARGP